MIFVFLQPESQHFANKGDMKTFPLLCVCVSVCVWSLNESHIKKKSKGQFQSLTVVIVVTVVVITVLNSCCCQMKMKKQCHLGINIYSNECQEFWSFATDRCERLYKYITRESQTFASVNAFVDLLNLHWFPVRYKVNIHTIYSHHISIYIYVCKSDSKGIAFFIWNASLKY